MNAGAQAVCRELAAAIMPSRYRAEDWTTSSEPMRRQMCIGFLPCATATISPTTALSNMKSTAALAGSAMKSTGRPRSTGAVRGRVMKRTSAAALTASTCCPVLKRSESISRRRRAVSGSRRRASVASPKNRLSTTRKIASVGPNRRSAAKYAAGARLILSFGETFSGKCSATAASTSSTTHVMFQSPGCAGQSRLETPMVNAASNPIAHANARTRTGAMVPSAGRLVAAG